MWLIDDRSRLAGEEASHEMMSDNMVAFISELFGRSLADVSNSIFLPHTKLRLSEQDGLLSTRVRYRNEDKEFSITAILAILLKQLTAEISAPFPSEVSL
jgi:hypothetical protein